jgi:hypothetical protein
VKSGRAGALLALACLLLLTGCQQDPVVLAGLQRELTEDGGPDGAGQDRDASDAAGASGSAGGTQTAGAAGGAGFSGASNCGDEPDWYWPTSKIVNDGCVVKDRRLLSWLEVTQRIFMIQPVGEEREFEPCDFSATWFYEDPNDPMRWIVCPSKCTFLEDLVRDVGERLAACRLDAGTAP